METVASPALADVMVREVDNLRRYVQSRMYGLPNDIEDTLQEARLAVWRAVDRFDPSRGNVDGYVFGIVSQVVARSMVRPLQRTGELSIESVLDSASAAGVFAALPWAQEVTSRLSGRQELTRLLDVVSDAASDAEWAVFVELARCDGDWQVAADHLQIPVRTLRAARSRVKVLVHVARAAFVAVDDGFAPDPLACVPDSDGLREVLPLVDADPTVAAAALGVVEGVFRTRRALARRVLNLLAAIAVSVRVTGP